MESRLSQLRNIRSNTFKRTALAVKTVTQISWLVAPRHVHLCLNCHGWTDMQTVKPKQHQRQGADRRE